MIIGGSISRKINALLNLINQQPHIDKVFLYAKDTYEEKYQLLIKKEKNVGPKHCNDPNPHIEYCSHMDNIYGNIDEYSPNIRLHLIAFDCI